MSWTQLGIAGTFDDINDAAIDGAAAVTAGGIQKYHEDGAFARGQLYELCGFGPEELGVPEIKYSDFSSKWSVLFHMMMLQYGITYFIVFLSIPVVFFL